MTNNLEPYKHSDYMTGPLNLLLNEKVTIEKALRKTSGNQKKASELLQITERTLYTKLIRHQIKTKYYEQRDNNTI